MKQSITPAAVILCYCCFPSWMCSFIRCQVLNYSHLGVLRSALADQHIQLVSINLSVCFSQEAEGSLPYLLVLCGDHGMSETGSHGGSSEPEVNTPLVLISPAFKRKGKLPCVV